MSYVGRNSRFLYGNKIYNKQNVAEGEELLTFGPPVAIVVRGDSYVIWSHDFADHPGSCARCRWSPVSPSQTQISEIPSTMTAWRNLFTYAVLLTYIPKNMLTITLRYNKYASITARAVRASLKEEERVVAEKRSLTNARYQKWENGVGGQYVCV